MINIIKINNCLLLLLLIVLYSCQKEKVYKIKEIYYRTLTKGASYSENQNGKVEYKSQIFIIFENDSGLIFDDKREVSKIDEIIKTKIKAIDSGIDLLSNDEIVHPIKRKRIDNNNFIITINNRTTHYNMIYKCNLTKNNDVRSKLYIMDKLDTVAVMESAQGDDSSGVYYFKKWEVRYGKTELRFPNYDNLIKREISKELPLFKKNGKTYEEEIMNFVKVQKLSMNGKPLIDRYQNNTLAIELTLTGPTIAGSDIYVNIKILDNSVYQQFQTRGDKTLYYGNNRLLTKTELALILNTLKYSKIKSDEFKLPVPEIQNNTQSLDLFIKYNNNIAIGGLLYPIKLTRSLENNYPNKKVYQDVANYTSTLKGNTDTLIKAVMQCFEKLDSLNKLIYK